MSRYNDSGYEKHIVHKTVAQRSVEAGDPVQSYPLMTTWREKRKLPKLVPAKPENTEDNTSEAVCELTEN